MKIRILNDTIRLRLDRDEVQRLENGARVRSVTHFPNDSSLICLMEVTADELSVDFVDGVLSINIPGERVTRWTSDDSDISIHGNIKHRYGELSILVEKDFECLEPRQGESQANRFPNPKAKVQTVTSSGG